MKFFEDIISQVIICVGLFVLASIIFFIFKIEDNREDAKTRLYLIEIVLENEPNISIMQLEDKVNKYYNIAKGIKND